MDNIKTNIDNVEKHLTSKPINQNNQYLKAHILQTGAEMFIYLNFCPPKLLKFYEDLLVQGSIKDIILAFTNIMKTRRNAEMLSTTKTWNKIREKLKFLKYKQIESFVVKNMSNHKGNNSTNNTSIEDLAALG